MKKELYDAIVEGKVEVLEKHNDEILLTSKSNGKNNCIHIAIRHERYEIVEEFLKRFPKNEVIWEENSQRNTPLHIAAEVGNLSIVKLLCKNLEDHEMKPWSLKNSEGNTPLHVAIIHDNIKIAKYLLNSDLDLALVVNNALEAPLHLAVTHHIDDEECKSVKATLARLISEEHAASLIKVAVERKSRTMIIDMLKQKSCVALWPDKNGLTPLHRAATLNGHYLVDVIRSILKHCPQSAQVCDAKGNSILHHLIGKKVSYKKLRNLLSFKEMNALRNHQNEQGNTPLHVAATCKDIDMVRALLESSAKLSVKNKAGISVASLFQQDLLDELKKIDMTSTESKAANEGNITYFNIRFEYSEYDLLLAQDSYGRNILHKLMQIENENHTVHQHFVTFIEKVIKSPQALARQTDNNGDTPVHILVRNRRDSTLERSGLMPRLLELYKQVTPTPWLVQNLQGNTPLHEAIIANNIIIVRNLLELYNKFIDDATWLVVQNVQGNTPVHEALIANNITLVRELLELYKNKHSEVAPWLMQNAQGNTPVHEALNANNIALIRELLEYDLTAVNIVNARGESPLHLITQCLVHCEKLEDEELKSMLEAYKVATASRLDKEGQTLWHVFVLNFPLILTLRLTYLCKDDSYFKELINKKNKNEETPLHLSINHQRFEHTAALILEFFPQVMKETDLEGKTPLHKLLLNYSQHVDLIKQCFALAENEGMVKDLLNLQDKKKITPLRLVIESRDFQLMRQCFDIAKKEDMWTELLCENDREKNTLLHLAIQGRHFGLVSDLLEFAKENDKVVEILLHRENKYGTKPSDLIGAVSDLPPTLEKLFTTEPKFRGIRSVYGIAKTEMKEYVNTMGVIAALLATITFTAAFTVPGGPIQDKGTPIFIKDAAFQTFMFFNVFTMCLSMMVLFCLLWIMATGDHRKSVMLMDFSMSVLQISFYTILLAFMTGVYATIKPVKCWIAMYTLVMCSLIILVMRKNHMVEFLGPFGTRVLIFVAKFFPDVVEIYKKITEWLNLCCSKRPHQDQQTLRV